MYYIHITEHETLLGQMSAPCTNITQIWSDISGNLYCNILDFNANTCTCYIKEEIVQINTKIAWKMREIQLLFHALI